MPHPTSSCLVDRRISRWHALCTPPTWPSLAWPLLRPPAAPTGSHGRYRPRLANQPRPGRQRSHTTRQLPCLALGASSGVWRRLDLLLVSLLCRWVECSSAAGGGGGGGRRSDWPKKAQWMPRPCRCLHPLPWLRHVHHPRPRPPSRAGQAARERWTARISHKTRSPSQRAPAPRWGYRGASTPFQSCAEGPGLERSGAIRGLMFDVTPLLTHTLSSSHPKPLVPPAAPRSRAQS